MTSDIRNRRDPEKLIQSIKVLGKRTGNADS